MRTNQPTDLELLALRAEDLRDRSVAIHFDRTATGREALNVASIIPADLVAPLEAAFNNHHHPDHPTTSPPALEECERCLAAEGWRVRTEAASLIYIMDPDVPFSSDVVMYRSDQSFPAWLPEANPGNWESVEWDELVSGKLGPWVMAINERRVVSLTHTANVMAGRSVEAGAWTDPAFRGRGHGSAATAQWANLHRDSGQLLFYSTSLDNRSSQRLAARLGLRLVGYQWLVRRSELVVESNVHPASTLATSASIPPIETDRLRLESMDKSLLRAFLHRDLRLAQRLATYDIPPDFSLLGKLSAVERRLRLIEADPAQHPWMFRAIVRKSDGALVGHISFHQKAPDPDLRRHDTVGAELGYTIEKAHRRNGYAKEAATGMMEWASTRFDSCDFVLTISPENLPSLRLAESMGFGVIGEQQDPVDGRELVMKADITRVLASKRP